MQYYNFADVLVSVDAIISFNFIPATDEGMPAMYRAQLALMFITLHHFTERQQHLKQVDSGFIVRAGTWS
jgi:hypothetical protein